MVITVYTLPNCSQCDATKRTLTRRKLEFSEIRIDQNPQLVSEFLGMGHSSAPIVKAGDEVWSGFRMDKIMALPTE